MKTYTSGAAAPPFWGFIGSNTLKASQQSSSQVVVRSRIDGGMEYILDGQSSKALKPLSWVVISESTCEMSLGSQDPASFRTLRWLRARLVGYHPKNPQTVSAIDELDAVFKALVGRVEQIRQLGFGAGLLQPDNVLYIYEPASSDPSGRSDPRAQGKARVLLPDVGFARTRTTLVPPWMRPDTEFAWLWDAPPETMLSACFDPKRFPEVADRMPGRPSGSLQFDSRTDVHTLARLCVWLLTGQPMVQIPVAGHDSSTIPPRFSALLTKAPIWNVLREALQPRGRFATAEDLRVELEDLESNAEPSQHFVEQHRQIFGVVRRSTRRLLAGLAIIAFTGLIVLGVGLAVPDIGRFLGVRGMLDGIFAPSVHPAFTKFDRAREAKDRDSQIAALKEMSDVELPPREGVLVADCQDQTLTDLEEDLQTYLKQDLRISPSAVRQQFQQAKVRFQQVFILKNGHEPTSEERPRRLKILAEFAR